MRTLFSLCLLLLAIAPTLAADQPNIVFFFADDQTSDMLGCLRSSAREDAEY